MMIEFSLFWLFYGIAATLLFWAATLLVILCIRQKRFLLLAAELPVLLLSYLLVQCCTSYTSAPETLTPLLLAVVSLPRGVLLLIALALGALELFLAHNHRRFEQSRITLMSMKEALDSFPSGLCYYLPGGQILLRNEAMDRLCLAITGEEPLSGEILREKLLTEPLPEGCERLRVEEIPLLRLADGTSWSVTEEENPYGRSSVRMLLVNDVTELAQKARSLRELQKKLTRLNEQLLVYNREIVALTAEKELLSARVRLHDEMGTDLLTIRRYIEQGGTEKDRADIEARLRRNVTFVFTGQASQTRDEYELILETAEKLGFTVKVRGELPKAEPQKHVAATAIHECFTNTLRHARGNELDVTIEDENESYVITLCNNGKQPEGPVQETGGLAALRSLTEQLPGGSMEITVVPRLCIRLTLPKEVPYEISSPGGG